MFNKVILVGRLGQNAKAKIAQNNRDYAVLNIATQESWKNDKGDYEPAPMAPRLAWQGLSNFAPGRSGKANSSSSKEPCAIARSRPKGSPSDGIAEIHASSLKRLSKDEATDDPHDGAGE